jgi:hypothetical protein
MGSVRSGGGVKGVLILIDGLEARVIGVD